MVNKECDNCGKGDKFNGWRCNDKGIQVFLCGKCKKEDEEFDQVISKEIFKTKLEARDGTS